MKINSIGIVLCISLLILGCSDNQKENKQESERHQTSAKVYQSQGQFSAAMLEAKNAIQLQPEESGGYVLLAKIYNQIGAYGATQLMLSKVVDTHSAVATELAESYVASKKYRTAINVINKYPAAIDDAETAQRQAALVATANIYLGDDNAYAEALESFDSLGGDFTEKQFIEANYLLAKGKIQDAEAVLSALIVSQPENVKALSLLGNLSIYSQKLSQAEKHLTTALGFLPKTDILTVERLQVLTALTDTLIQQGRTSEAYTYQKVIAESNPESSAAQQRFNEAMEYYQQGKYAEAESILNELREQFPQDKKTATLLGMVEYQQGADDRAADLFDEFIDPETATPTVIQAAALVKYRSNKVDEAIELLKTATENQPNNAAILATYGLALLDRDEKSTDGAKALEKSLALNPQQQRVRIALAKRYRALEQPEQAIAQLQKAYEAQPLDLVVQQAYLRSLFENDQAEKVKEEIIEFKKQFPDSGRGPFIEGWYFMEQKDYKSAEQAFEKAVSMATDSEKQLSYLGLAQIFEIQKQPQKAIAAWQMAITADPNMRMAYSRWLKLMRELKREAEALVFLQSLEKNTTSWYPSVVLAQLVLTEKKLPQAIEHIELALERSKNANNVKQIAASLYQAQGVAFRTNKQLHEARSSMLEAVKLYPENVDFLAGLIQIEIVAENISEAQRLLDSFEWGDKNEAARLFLQGVIRFAEKKPEEGIKLLRQSWGEAQTEGVADAIYTYYLRNQQENLAALFVTEWTEKLPKSERAALIRAVNEQKNNNKEESIKWYEKTIELSPDMPIALNNLAWMYYELKDERALPLAKKAASLAPASPEILDTYGWILVETGNLQEGIKILEQAAAIAGGNEEIQSHLMQAKARQ